MLSATAVPVTLSELAGMPGNCHVPKHQNVIQLCATGDGRGDSRGVTAVREEAEWLQQAVAGQCRGIYSGSRGHGGGRTYTNRFAVHDLPTARSPNRSGEGALSRAPTLCEIAWRHGDAVPKATTSRAQMRNADGPNSRWPFGRCVLRALHPDANLRRCVRPERVERRLLVSPTGPREAGAGWVGEVPR
jgi:hypothetical protein